MSRDPIGEEGGMNLTAFVANDPNDWHDRLGSSFGPRDHFTYRSTRVDPYDGQNGSSGDTWVSAVVIAMRIDSLSWRCQCGAYLEAEGGNMRVAWGVVDTSDKNSIENEQEHVEDLRKLGWEPLVAYVLSLEGCYKSAGQALCYKRVATGEAIDHFVTLAKYASVVLRDLARDPTNDYYREQVRVLRQASASAGAALVNAVRQCATMGR